MACDHPTKNIEYYQFQDDRTGVVHHVDKAESCPSCGWFIIGPAPEDEVIPCGP